MNSLKFTKNQVLLILKFVAVNNEKRGEDVYLFFYYFFIKITEAIKALKYA